MRVKTSPFFCRVSAQDPANYVWWFLFFSPKTVPQSVHVRLIRILLASVYTVGAPNCLEIFSRTGYVGRYFRRFLPGFILSSMLGGASLHETRGVYTRSLQSPAQRSELTHSWRICDNLIKYCKFNSLLPKVKLVTKKRPVTSASSVTCGKQQPTHWGN